MKKHDCTDVLAAVERSLNSCAALDETEGHALHQHLHGRLGDGRPFSIMIAVGRGVEGLRSRASYDTTPDPRSIPDGG